MNIGSIVTSLPPFLRRHKLIQLLLIIWPNSRVQLIHFNDSARIFADLGEPWPRQTLITGICEPEFFTIAAKFLSKGGIFFDVGANTGALSFGLMADFGYPNVEYHLFEANSKISQLLIQSRRLYPEEKIWINNFCVTAKSGFSKLNVDLNNSPVSFISPTGNTLVENLILDEYISERNITKINFLKMDIEGHEPFAINGLMNSLKKGIVEAIYIELSSKSLFHSGFCAKDVFNLLKEGGFHLFFVKRADFESGIASKSRIFTLNVYGSPLTVAEVEIENFPNEYQTDILAIHEKAHLDV
ncbi:FkbM family methyltransferase [Argonema galeatum]|uniref:FkbM family methyltransferase n=1 Tax=Argonema galeatum TaxID=2942762 RepID=UPI002010CF32|nr:FkbM family methyltransferase [Argonema galeatum]MCL1468544.1 FkbM family methyltransferase [Argonema galeatum A003/A1]